MRPFLPLVFAITAAPALAAPQLKPKPYQPADWIDKLANDPPEVRPWAAMEERVRDLDEATWAAVGCRLSERLHERAARLGLRDCPTVFDVEKPDDWIGLTREYVAAVLYQWKWLEHHGWDTPIDSPQFFPPAWFWWGNRDAAPEWTRR